MKLVLQYFYKKRQVIGWSILCGLIYLLIFSLSGIDLKAAVYRHFYVWFLELSFCWSDFSD